MRLIGNARRRVIRAASTPLEICPGRQIWEKHRAREYLVFVDESFYRFFGFEAVDGNFCHATIGVPVDNYAPLQKLLAPALDAYIHEVTRATGAPPNELRFSTLRQLPIRFRLVFTKKLVRSLVETGVLSLSQSSVDVFNGSAGSIAILTLACSEAEHAFCGRGCGRFWRWEVGR